MLAPRVDAVRIGALLALLMVAGLLPRPASAAWTERGATISSLKDILPHLQAAVGKPVRSVAADDAPVLLPAGVDLSDPKALAVAIVHSGIAIRRQPAEWALTAANPRAERERAQARLRRATETRPSPADRSAIASGAVVVFGRLLDAPYRIERVDQSVVVNGVTVYPSPGLGAPGPAVTPAVLDKHARIQAAMRDYPALRTRLGDAPARARILEDLGALPGVVSAEWVNDTYLRLVQSNGIEEGLSFEPKRAAEPQSPAESRERLDEMVAGLTDVLRNGGALVCGATYLLTVPAPDGAAFRERVNAIRASGDPDALKLARIQAWTGHREAAADILFSN